MNDHDWDVRADENDWDDHTLSGLMADYEEAEREEAAWLEYQALEFMLGDD